MIADGCPGNENFRGRMLSDQTGHNKMNTTDPVRILVAEDNRVMGNVMKFNLERSGFNVVLVHDGQTAIKQLEQDEFDIVITDYQMPHASGEDVCRHVRFDSAQQHMPVILVSAKGIELNTDELTGPSGFSRIVYKPFSPREIVRIVGEVLEPATA